MKKHGFAAVQMTRLGAARYATKVLRRWAEHQNDPNGRLMMAIVDAAVMDLVTTEHRRNALRWFKECDSNTIITALGLDGEAVREVLDDAGLWGEQQEAPAWPEELAA